MKNIWLLLFLCFCGCSSNHNMVSFHLQKNAFFRTQANSVVKVYDFHMTTIGTGLVVYKDKSATYVITNAHVVFDPLVDLTTNLATVESIGDYDNLYNSGLMFGGKIISCDFLLDVALIKIPYSISILSPAKLINHEFPSIGSKVYEYGFPMNNSLTLVDGMISRYYYDKVYLHIQATCPIWKGMSGGGLFTEDGKIVGILQRMAKEGPYLINNYADYISSYEILKFLDNNGYKKSLLSILINNIVYISCNIRLYRGLYEK